MAAMARSAKPDARAELDRYLAGETVDINAVIRRLPDDIDVPTAASVVREMIGANTFWFARSCQQLPVPVIRALLAEPSDAMAHLFLRLAVPLEGDATAIAARWQRALVALLDLDLTYAWGSQQRRARLRALARDPHLLAAIQGTVAHRDDVKLDMLAVLVADGSDASFDALVRHVDPAVVHKDVRLDRLARLRTHAANTPALDALFAELDGVIAKRNAVSPALALGPLIGLGRVDPLWFQASIGSREPGDRVARVQGHVTIDSRRPKWFGVSMARNERGGLTMQHTIFDAITLHSDELGIGRCDAAELPGWLAVIAAKLGVTWDEPRVRTHIRGARRARIAAWLCQRSA
jgi:hypothetical protein